MGDSPQFLLVWCGCEVSYPQTSSVDYHRDVDDLAAVWKKVYGLINMLVWEEELLFSFFIASTSGGLLLEKGWTLSNRHVLWLIEIGLGLATDDLW